MFIVLYDEEFQFEADTQKECIDYILEDYQSYQEDRKAFPECYEEDEDFPFNLYRIDTSVLDGDQIEDLVKNSC